MTMQSPNRFKRTVRAKMHQILDISREGTSPEITARVKRALLSIQRDARRNAAAMPSRAAVRLNRRDLSVVDFGIGDFYSLTLTTKPSAEVAVGVYDPMRQVACFPSVVSFNAVNFKTPQVIRVMCSDATAYDENFSFLEHTVTSTDLRYHHASVPTMVVRIFAAPSSFAWGFGDGHEGQLGMEGPFPTSTPSQIHISYSKSAAATASLLRAPAKGSTSSATAGTAEERKQAELMDIAAKRSRVDISSVACGHTHSAFVTSEGQLFTFGEVVAADPNQPSLYGRSTAKAALERPALKLAGRYPTLWHGQDVAKDLHSVITSVSCGQEHAAALTDNGILLTWGSAANGRLGLGPDARSTGTPTVVPYLKQDRIIQVSCGAHHTAAVTNSGALYTWGMASTGALGLGDVMPHARNDVSIPVRVQSIRDTVFAVACGNAHTVALCHNGSAHSCGWKDNGRLGRKPSSLEDEAVFRPVRANRSREDPALFVAVAVGGAHTLLLAHTRQVLAFGDNAFGQLGTGDKNDRWAPTEVDMLAGRKVFTIATGKRHSVAVSERGVLYAWGNSDSGQLGLPNTNVDCTPFPTVVDSFLGLGPSLVAAGGSHTIVTTATTPYLQQRMDNLDPVNAALRRNNMRKLQADEAAHHLQVERRVRRRMLARLRRGKTTHEAQSRSKERPHALQTRSAGKVARGEAKRDQTGRNVARPAVRSWSVAADRAASTGLPPASPTSGAGDSPSRHANDAGRSSTSGGSPRVSPTPSPQRPRGGPPTDSPLGSQRGANVHTSARPRESEARPSPHTPTAVRPEVAGAGAGRPTRETPRGAPSSIGRPAPKASPGSTLAVSPVRSRGRPGSPGSNVANGRSPGGNIGSGGSPGSNVGSGGSPGSNVGSSGSPGSNVGSGGSPGSNVGRGGSPGGNVGRMSLHVDVSNDTMEDGDEAGVVNPARVSDFPPPRLPDHHVAVRDILGTFTGRAFSVLEPYPPREATKRAFPPIIRALSSLLASHAAVLADANVRAGAAVKTPRFDSDGRPKPPPQDGNAAARIAALGAKPHRRGLTAAAATAAVIAVAGSNDGTRRHAHRLALLARRPATTRPRPPRFDSARLFSGAPPPSASSLSSMSSSSPRSAKPRKRRPGAPLSARGRRSVPPRRPATHMSGALTARGRGPGGRPFFRHDRSRKVRPSGTLPARPKTQASNRGPVSRPPESAEAMHGVMEEAARARSASVSPRRSARAASRQRQQQQQVAVRADAALARVYEHNPPAATLEGAMRQYGGPGGSVTRTGRVAVTELPLVGVGDTAPGRFVAAEPEPTPAWEGAPEDNPIDRAAAWTRRRPREFSPPPSPEADAYLRGFPGYAAGDEPAEFDARPGPSRGGAGDFDTREVASRSAQRLFTPSVASTARMGQARGRRVASAYRDVGRPGLSDDRLASAREASDRGAVAGGRWDEAAFGAAPPGAPPLRSNHVASHTRRRNSASASRPLRPSRPRRPAFMSAFKKRAASKGRVVVLGMRHAFGV